MAFDASGLAGVGVAAATGNYVGAAIGLLGMGVSMFGENEKANHAAEAARISQENVTISKEIGGYEQNINEQKYKAMQLSARRQQMEVIRNTQRNRAMGTQAAVSQGALQGSGYAGGQAQEQAMGFYNLKGVNQNLGIGEDIFDITGQISGAKMRQSDVQSRLIAVQGQMAGDEGVAAMGASISRAAEPLGRLSGQLYSSGPGSATQANPYGSMPQAGRDF